MATRTSIPLPPGRLPAAPVFTPDLAVARVTGYRFELLDNHETVIGNLDTARPGGGLEFHATNSIKSGGTLEIYDPLDVRRFDSDVKEIDWLHTRIKPYMTLEAAQSPASRFERPLGIYLPAAPQSTVSGGARSWSVELTDKGGELDRQKSVGENGRPYSFVAREGDNVLDLIKSIISDAGESVEALGDDSETISSDQVWEMNSSKLAVINDLLANIGYFSLYCDNYGRYRADQYVSPRMREPKYTGRDPFTDDPAHSMMSPEWTMDRDYFNVPNMVIAVMQGDGSTGTDDETGGEDDDGLGGDVGPVVAVATNEDDGSPFSYHRRDDTWYPEVLEDVEASSEASLQAQAEMKLAQASSVVSSMSIKHLYLPDMTINDTMMFHNDQLGLDYLCSVLNTTIPFNATEMCETTLKEAVV